MADQILSRFRGAVSSGKLFFSYTVTIQNHMSYTADKYGAGYKSSTRRADLGGASPTPCGRMLSVYIAKGARDADAMLGRLVREFSASPEPVVLVFWGDHLPYLGDGQQGYRELGSPVTAGQDGQTPLVAYETPYVIWANDAAAQALDWDERRGLPERCRRTASSAPAIWAARCWS
jgi:hypothetical protein